VNLTAKQQSLVAAFLDQRLARFRRADVAEVLHRTISPRNPRRATALADVALRTFSREGRIVREGHLHWKVANHLRTLLDGRQLPEYDRTTKLTITTRVPEKWVAVDLETGEVYGGSPQGWRRADKGGASLTAAAAVLAKLQSADG